MGEGSRVTAASRDPIYEVGFPGAAICNERYDARDLYMPPPPPPSSCMLNGALPSRDFSTWKNLPGWPQEQQRAAAQKAAAQAACRMEATYLLAAMQPRA